MRKLTYYVASTIDGFVAGPEGGDPTGPGGFWTFGEDYLKHMVANYPETLPGPARSALGITDEATHFDTVIEGRASYEIGIDAGVPDAYPHLRHLVFSRTLSSVPAPAVELVASDPIECVRELKQQAGKDIWLIGGGTIAGALYPEIDELIIKLSPITTGTGIGLFGAQASFDPAAWKLADSTVLPGGAAFLTYARQN
ncbi:dihydrofolate reductase family protein [Solicola gregarius]|uniref:Dihydrofolate reductase family protein n=1 Tax=Solicola gregarius TaxID=2908642 RepID=A0AA46TLV9_9ACTN|nr:dihydrofolate reductase family protein [Solicola gregarius]UYM07702.1 dihydrofolate reductase family protein [Solicola gregarius]